MRDVKAVAVVLLGILLVSGQQILHARVNEPLVITITDPSGPVQLSETEEYATLVWNDPWDMSDALDVQHLDSPKCVWPFHNSFEDGFDWCPEGVWCGFSNEDNPDLFLLHPGYQGAMHVGRNGHVRSIDANRYTLLTFRMYISEVSHDDPGFQIIWTDGTVADIGGSDDRYGGTVLYQTYAGWNVYTIDLSAYQSAAAPSPHKGTLPWTGDITGLRLDPGLVGMKDKIVQLDWVRLSVSNTYQLNWTSDQSGVASITLYSRDGVGVNDSLRMYDYQPGQSWSSPLSVSISQGSLAIPASLPSGDWYVKLSAVGEESAFAGPWQIKEAPTLQFTKPSYTSGEDYAHAVLGNPWDMSDAADVRSYVDITTPQFSSGVMSATSLDTNPLNTCSGYWENPNIVFVDDSVPAMDTSKYRYFTFRLKLDGAPDISYGWVARVVWSNSGFGNAGVTNDIPLHAGWNEVSLDLWSTDSNFMDDEDPNVSPWQDSANRRLLRLDPLECPEATKFYVDQVMLTANDVVTSGDIFEVKYQLNQAENVDVTFYYDTDQDPGGRHLAQEYLPDPPPDPTGPHFIYLPMIANNYPSSNQIFQWDTTGVNAGTYYVCADVSNSYLTTTWCSETPVIVMAP